MGKIVNISPMANREDNLQEIVDGLQKLKDALEDVYDVISDVVMDEI